MAVDDETDCRPVNSETPGGVSNAGMAGRRLGPTSIYGNGKKARQNNTNTGSVGQ